MFVKKLKIIYFVHENNTSTKVIHSSKSFEQNIYKYIEIVLN